MKKYLDGFKIGLGVITPVIIAILLASTVFATQIPVFNSPSSNWFLIPDLSRGQSYIVELGNGSYTCVDLENKLGFPRGFVKQIETDEYGNVKITFIQDYKLNDLQINSLSTIIGKPVKEIKAK